ncbi:MAG: hypothetical protein AAGK02_07020 [Pseudomonadota bacterium]
MNGPKADLSKADETPPLNPYPGLRSFEPDQADVFFGRDASVWAMIERLERHHFLAVTGPSGCGKSSLVKAGLIRRLKANGLPSAGMKWRVATFRPGGHPLTSFARALNGVAPEEDQSSDAIAECLSTGPAALVNWINQCDFPEDENLLLIVDQFEEVFRYERSNPTSKDELEDTPHQTVRARERAHRLAHREEVERFVQLLLHTSAHSDAEDFEALLTDQFDSENATGDIEVREIVDPDQPKRRIYIILTMRLDYLGDCAQIDGLAEAINDSQFLVPRLTRDEMATAIREPARRAGGDVDAHLLSHILNDIAFDPDRDAAEEARRPDQLPLMQHVLNWMWAREQTRLGAAPVLSLETYANPSVGGFEHALSRDGRDIWSSLDNGTDDLRMLAKRVFQALAEPNQGGRLGRDVRRPIPFRQLVDETGEDQTKVIKVLNRFRGAMPGEASSAMGRARRPGFITIEPAPTVQDGHILSIEPTASVDISHESLIRQWDQYWDWVDEERRDRNELDALAHSAARYASEQGGDLLGPRATGQARRWMAERNPTPAWAARSGVDLRKINTYLNGSSRRRTLYYGFAAMVGAIVVATVGTTFWADQRAKLFEEHLADQLSRGIQDAFDERPGAVGPLRQAGTVLDIDNMANQRQRNYNTPAERDVAMTSVAMQGLSPLSGDAVVSQMHAGTVTAVDVTAGGGLMATGDRYGLVHVSDVSTGSLLSTLDHSGASIRSVAFQPGAATTCDGEGNAILATGSQANLVRFWDPCSGTEYAYSPLAVGDNPNDLGFSADGRFLIVSLNDPKTPIYDMLTLAEPEDDGPKPFVVLDRESERGQASNEDWETAMDRWGSLTWGLHGSFVHAAPQDGRYYVATGSDASTAALWSFSVDMKPSVRGASPEVEDDNSTLVHVFDDLGGTPRSAALSPDQTQLAIALSQDGITNEITGGITIAELNPDDLSFKRDLGRIDVDESFRSLAFDAPGNLLAASSNGWLKRYAFVSGEEPDWELISAHRLAESLLDFKLTSINGEPAFAAASGNPNVGRIVPEANLNRLPARTHDDFRTLAGAHFGGNRVRQIMDSNGKNAIAFDMGDETVIRSIPHVGMSFGVASPNSAQAVLVDRESNLFLWERDGAALLPLQGGPENLVTTGVSENGDWVFAVGEDEILFWASETGGSPDRRHALRDTPEAFWPGDNYATLAIASDDPEVIMVNLNAATVTEHDANDHQWSRLDRPFSASGNYFYRRSNTDGGGWDVYVEPVDAVGETQGQPHFSNVQPGVRISPDERWVATSESPDQMTLVDIETRRRVYLRARTDDGTEASIRNWVDTFAFSPDGQWLAAIGQDGEVIVWNMERLLAGGAGPFIAEQILKPDVESPDRDSALVFGAESNELFIAVQGQLVSFQGGGSSNGWEKVAEHDGDFDCSSGGAIYAVGEGSIAYLCEGANGVVWSSETGDVETIQDFRWGILPEVFVQGESTDLEQDYALTKLSGSVIGQTVLTGMVGITQSVDLSTDGQTAVSVGSEGDLIVYELANPGANADGEFSSYFVRTHDSIPFASNPMDTLLVGEGGNVVYGSTKRNDAFLYDTDTGTSTIILDGSDVEQQTRNVWFSYDLRSGFMALEDGTLASFTYQSGEAVITPELPPEEPFGRLIISPDGKFIALTDGERIHHRNLPNGAWQTSDQVFDASDKKPYGARSDAHHRFVPGFRSESQLLLAATTRGELAVVDYARGTVGAKLAFDSSSAINQVAMWGVDWTSDDARRLFYMEREESGGTVLSVHQLIDFETVLTLAEYRLNDHKQTLGFVDDGRALQVIDDGGLLNLPIWTPSDPGVMRSIDDLKGEIVSDIEARYPPLEQQKD